MLGMYADSLMPLIQQLKETTGDELKQIFYADDAASAAPVH